LQRPTATGLEKIPRGGVAISTISYRNSRNLDPRHHAALPYPDVPAFIEKVRSLPSLASRPLEFLILTAARSGEVLGATWDEIDFKEKIWALPATRMKTGRTHRVPLSDRALAILAKQKDGLVNQKNSLVFPGQRPGRPISGWAVETLVHRIAPVTVHGFRSSFRDWAGDLTNTQREVVEAALAHAVGSQVEQAYRRSDALQKRRALMEAWAEYCNSNVLKLPIGVGR
jgi:integrase